MIAKFAVTALLISVLSLVFVAGAGSPPAQPQAKAPVAGSGATRSADSRDEPPFLPDGLPLHTRDELGLIVRQVDSGDMPTARSHWRRLVASETRAGRGDNIQRYLQWVLAQAYRDEIRTADELLDENRFYDRLQRELRRHEQSMRQLRAKLSKGEMRVVRAVAHLPIYRPKDTPEPRPQYAPRQMDRDALAQYLQQLHRDLEDLGRDVGLKQVDLPAAQENRAKLSREIKSIAAVLRHDAVVAASNGH